MKKIVANIFLLTLSVTAFAQEDSANSEGYGGKNLAGNVIVESSRTLIKATVDPIVVFGPVVGKLGNSVAQCPAGTKVLGGGYQLLSYAGSGLNAPDTSRPNSTATGWLISGTGGNSTFRPWAVCG